MKIRKFSNGLKRVFLMLGIILLYFILQIGFGYYYRDILTSSSTFIKYFSEVLIYALIILIISLLFIPKLVNDFKTFKSKYISVGLSNWIKGFGLMLISNFIIRLIIGNIANNEVANREALFEAPILSIILMVFLAPLLEEIVFRLNIRKHIKNKWIFLILSSLLFGGAHVIASNSLIELLYIIPYGCLGFYLAKSFEDTNNIFTSIIVHMTHNAFAIVLILSGGLL